MTNTAVSLTESGRQLQDDCVGFLSSLSDKDLAAQCADHGGSTVADVAAHLQEGTLMFRGWLTMVTSEEGAARQPAGGDQPNAHAQAHAQAQAHAHAHAHPHPHPHSNADAGPPSHFQRALFGLRSVFHSRPKSVQPAESAAVLALPSDPKALSEWFAQQMSAAVASIAELSDRQLASVPPATAGLADGQTDLGGVIGMALDHQRDHLAIMTDAVETSRRESS